MQKVYPKTTAIVLANIVFLGLNILLFSSKLKTSTQNNSPDSSKDKYPELFVNHLDPGIIYEQKRSGFHESSQPIRIPQYDPHYKVPSIETTTLVNCKQMLSGSEDELLKAEKEMKQRPKVPVYEENYLEWTKDCSQYKKSRGFVMTPLSQEEADFPLAFSIAMYKDIEQAERLLRMIYQPQNIYCIHIDIQASVLIHRTMHHITNCFPNVFIASHLDKIKWGDVSVLLPDLNCMRDLIKYYKGKWKYYINLTGQEMPLRTNYELVRIAKIYNGSNDIAGSKSRVEAERVKYLWSHQWSKTYQQTIFYNTFQPKAPPPHNLEFYKGELHGLFTWRMVEYIVESEVAREYLDWCWDSGHPSEHYWNVLNYNRHLKAPGSYIVAKRLRVCTYTSVYKGELHGLFTWRMVEYIVESEVAREYLDWCWDSGHPSEHYWNVLNYNRHLKAPGSYIGDQALADAYSPEPIIRAKNWMSFYNNRQCEGKFVRGICVYGVRDLPWLHKRPELFANKFHLTYHYLAYDCLEERHRNRTQMKNQMRMDEHFYRHLPTVKYSRKDGLL